MINKHEQESNWFVFIYKLLHFLSNLFDKWHTKTVNKSDKSVVFNKGYYKSWRLDITPYRGPRNLNMMQN